MSGAEYYDIRTISTTGLTVTLDNGRVENISQIGRAHV